MADHAAQGHAWRVPPRPARTRPRALEHRNTRSPGQAGEEARTLLELSWDQGPCHLSSFPARPSAQPLWDLGCRVAAPRELEPDVKPHCLLSPRKLRDPPGQNPARALRRCMGPGLGRLPDGWQGQRGWQGEQDRNRLLKSDLGLLPHGYFLTPPRKRVGRVGCPGASGWRPPSPVIPPTPHKSVRAQESLAPKTGKLRRRDYVAVGFHLRVTSEVCGAPISKAKFGLQTERSGCVRAGTTAKHGASRAEMRIRRKPVWGVCRAGRRPAGALSSVAVRKAESGRPPGGSWDRAARKATRLAVFVVARPARAAGTGSKKRRPRPSGQRSGAAAAPPPPCGAPRAPQGWRPGTRSLPACAGGRPRGAGCARVPGSGQRRRLGCQTSAALQMSAQRTTGFVGGFFKVLGWRGKAWETDSVPCSLGSSRRPARRLGPRGLAETWSRPTVRRGDEVSGGFLHLKSRFGAGCCTQRPPSQAQPGSWPTASLFQVKKQNQTDDGPHPMHLAEPRCRHAPIRPPERSSPQPDSRVRTPAGHSLGPRVGEGQRPPAPEGSRFPNIWGLF